MMPQKNRSILSDMLAGLEVMLRQRAAALGAGRGRSLRRGRRLRLSDQPGDLRPRRPRPTRAPPSPMRCAISAPA
jgi:hypothetical protein